MHDQRPDDTSVRDAGTSTSSPAKQPYQAPTLVDYGTVAELTQGAQGTRTDGHPVKKFVQA